MPQISVQDFYIHEWFPEEEPKHIVFGIHGLGAHGGWFERLATRLNKHGIAFYSFDLKGFGKSNYQRGHIQSFKEWRDDCAEFYKVLKEKYPNIEITILGHSLGGVIASTLSKISFGDRLILSVPGFKGAPETWDFFGFVLPTLAKVIFAPGLYIDLPEPTEKYENADLRVRSVTAQLMGQILKLGAEAEKQISKVQCPTLFLQCELDEVISNTALEEHYSMVPSSNKELKLFKDTKHDWIFYDAVDVISEEVARWVKS